MLKSVLIGASLAVLSSAAAHAETLFIGVLRITSTTSACAGHISVGDHWNAQLHPGSVTGTAQSFADWSISEFGSSHAVSYHLPGGAKFTTAFQVVTNRSIGWSDYVPDRSTSVKVTAQTPATIDSASKTVTLAGSLLNPWGDIGQETCTAGFSFAGVNDQQ